MTRVYDFNCHRWIIFHVALIVLTPANAQSGQEPHKLPSGHHDPSRSTVFAVLITVFFLIGLLSVYIRHCGQPNPGNSGGNFRRENDDGCSRRGGLENAVVESFPVFAYATVKESKIGSNDLECAICLNEFGDSETVRLLPICNHLFHIDCIDAWLHAHVTCPVCRCDLTAKTDDSPARDQVVIDIDDIVVRPNSVISGKYPRSNSTGHSMDRLSGGVERFTLRLPEDVKRRIMAAKGRKLKRTRSFDGDLTAKYWPNGEESSSKLEPGGKLDRVSWAGRWGLFVSISKSNSGSVRSQSNSGSVRSPRNNGESLK